MSDGLDNWSDPPAQPELSKESIHLWRIRLDVSENRLGKYAELLSHDERDRAESFHFAKHRNRFIACRGQLRSILTAYVGSDPRKHQLGYGAHGKPSLIRLAANAEIQFNVSKSNEFALVAITEGREVGVDIEQFRLVADAEQIAKRFFSSSESRQLASLGAERRNLAFLHIWTQKEAILKAIGKGLYFPLNQLTVDADPDVPARVIGIEGNEGDAADWHVVSLRPAPQYLGAVASLGDARSIHCWAADRSL